MVTVHRAGGLRFVIYTQDHRPAHVHVVGDGGQARVALGATGGIPVVLSNTGLARGELRRAMIEIGLQAVRLRREWERIHGPD